MDFTFTTNGLLFVWFCKKVQVLVTVQPFFWLKIKGKFWGGVGWGGVAWPYHFWFLWLWVYGGVLVMCTPVIGCPFWRVPCGPHLFSFEKLPCIERKKALEVTNCGLLAFHLTQWLIIHTILIMLICSVDLILANV